MKLAIEVLLTMRLPRRHAAMWLQQKHDSSQHIVYRNMTSPSPQCGWENKCRGGG
jgi:hypothetical protein